MSTLQAVLDSGGSITFYKNDLGSYTDKNDLGSYTGRVIPAGDGRIYITDDFTLADAIIRLARKILTS
jgi:hypothetical protein